MHLLPGIQGALHGEMVAFGTIAQLVLENYRTADIRKTIEFCNSVGLPVTLKQLGVSNVSREVLMKAAEFACVDATPTRHAYSEIDPEMILGAVIGADCLGEESLSSMKKLSTALASRP